MEIELLIKIPEGLKKDFESEQWTALSCMEMKDALMNGILLPKGHGKLKDVSKIEALLDLNKADNKIAKALKNIIDSVPTIIESEEREAE